MVPFSLNGNQQDTLRQIYANPVPVNLEWRKVESLLLAIGCQLVEGRGSRVRFEKNGKVATFHRPHPVKEASLIRLGTLGRNWNCWGLHHEHDELQRVLSPN